MKASVVICTWNRAALLDRAFYHLQKLQIPKGMEWEVVVVDNNSTDSTNEIIKKHTGPLPIQSYFEPRQGVAHARNLATQSAKGEWLFCLDDDVEVSSDWFLAYLAATDRWPTAAYFGGVITPRFEVPPARWITENPDLLSGAILSRDLGPEERILVKTEAVYGANIAYRLSIFRTWHFDSRLGPRGKVLIAGEETHLQKQLQESGEFGVWIPKSKVQHYVPAQRATLSFVRNHCVSVGKMDTRIHGLPAGQTPAKVLGWLLLQYGAAFAKSIWLRLRRDSRWLSTYCHAARLKGNIIEAYLSAPENS